MITAVHTLFYSDDPTATRAFFADVLELPFVSEGEDREPSSWLIFRSGPSEIGVHPTTGPAGEQWAPPGQHQLTFMCDDVAATVEQLRGRGAEFAGEPADMGFGVGVPMKVPGGEDILLYEPRHSVAHDLPV
jgi:catechol 2,3-dioxygenase-like lactoylglutathione lyase family enzyme